MQRNYLFLTKRRHIKKLFLLFLMDKISWNGKLKGYKLMSDIFFLFCFLSLKERTFEARKNPYYFTSKGPKVLEILKFQNFRILNFIKPSNALVRNNKYLLLNSFGSKHSLVMKFGHFM